MKPALYILKPQFSWLPVLAAAAFMMLSTPGVQAETIGLQPSSDSLFGIYSRWRMSSVSIEPASSSASKKPDPQLNEAFITDETSETPDPLEPVNRAVFGLNELLEKIVLKPVNFVYRTVIPTPLRGGISNAVANAHAPVTFANDLLQGKPDRAKTTFMRFVINSTAGFGGLVDAAQAGGLEPHTEDFGQTLAVWGVASGPYMVAPVLGPATPRHLVGRAVDTVIDPLTWILWDLPLLERSTPTMADTITTHDALTDDLDALRKTSPDLYSSVRDIYLQKRKSEISNGDASLDPLPEIPNP